MQDRKAPIVDVNVNIVNQCRKYGMPWLQLLNELLRIITSALEKWKDNNPYQVRYSYMRTK
jgi:hypothetical protein